MSTTWKFWVVFDPGNGFQVIKIVLTGTRGFEYECEARRIAEANSAQHPLGPLPSRSAALAAGMASERKRQELAAHGWVVS